MGRKIVVTLGSAEEGRFKDLMEMTGADTSADVIKSALRLFEHMVLEDKRGVQLHAPDSSGTLVPYDVFEKSRLERK